MQPYIREWAGDFASRISLVTYDELFRSRRIPLVTHVFTDLECLEPEEREAAAFFWRALDRSRASVRLLNHPLTAMRRYELLRHLRDNGVNDFNAYRLTEHRKPEKFPVFVRSEDDHAGPESDLLYSQAELDAVIDRLTVTGKCLENRLVIEYSAQPSDQGVYTKYGVFYVGGAVIPRHILCSTHWLVKGKSSFVDESVIRAEKEFIDSNPHAGQVRQVFELAHIDYGRIDYGVVDGRVQVYEINSNPTIFSAGPWVRTEKKERFAKALTESFIRLEESTSQAGKKVQWLDLDPPYKDLGGRLASRLCAWVFGRQFRPIL